MRRAIISFAELVRGAASSSRAIECPLRRTVILQFAGLVALNYRVASPPQAPLLDSAPGDYLLSVRCARS